MKFLIVCIFCSKVVQQGDKDAPTSYVVCDECKRAISNELGMKINAVVVQGESNEKDKG